MRILFKDRSLRFWVALGMIISLAPLTISALVSQLILNRSVIDAFHDVAQRQRDELGPLQDLRILVWDTLVPMDEYINEGGSQRPLLYRELRTRIENGFAQVRVQFADDPQALQHLDAALVSWQGADMQATELISDFVVPDDPSAERQLKLFHGHIAAASDRLGQAHDTIVGILNAQYQSAIDQSARTGQIFGIALALSLFAMVAGVAIISLILSRSIDRLVDGAARFADGDRHHRIDIAVPPELKKVAQEFNRMISRIEVSETALADLARVDELTTLHNRRAFDEALLRAHSNVVGGMGAGALLAMDIDHFKRVNDTYGHAAGDAVLRAFATTVRKSIRGSDQLYRTGGEEFAIIMAQTDPDTAVDLANRIREAVSAEPISYREETIAVTTSIGVAGFSEALAPNEALEAADMALYRAKTAGRNQVVLAS